MVEKSDDKNRFGNTAQTAIPDDAPLRDNPGHKLRTSNTIVDRQQLASDQAEQANIRTVQFQDQTGFVRLPETQEKSVEAAPNLFTGPSFRNPQERFRFDGHKMLYHLDRVADWQKGVKFPPIHIDMGLTKFCNTACIYCYAVVQNMTKGVMIQEDTLLKYIEDCGRLGVKSIGFIGDGEPTLNPAMYDAAVLAKKVGVDTSMATNGLLFNMDRAFDMLRDMSYIRINLSAGTPEGFKRVHQSASKNFAVLVEKIRTLVQIKKENKLPCTIGLQMVLVPECFDQVMAEAQLGAELGVDYFVIKQCADSEYKEIGIDYKEYEKIEKTLHEAEKLSTKDYVVQAKWNKINAAKDTPLYKDGIRKYDICYGTPFLAQISGNGKVYPCGPFYNKDRFLMGDIHEQSFYDIVMGDRYWDVHKDIARSVDVHKDCAIGCRQDYINKFLWDLKNPPEHVNFI
ncbi:MAG: radical SAM protein [Magnetococcales bacterium]|nr:radical SAM protein [Magnetococcales bacterium]